MTVVCWYLLKTNSYFCNYGSVNTSDCLVQRYQMGRKEWVKKGICLNAADQQFYYRYLSLAKQVPLEELLGNWEKGGKKKQAG